jgi:hypothetical protein
VLTAAIARAGAAAGEASQRGLDAAAGTAQVSLCVEVLPLQQSTELGQATQWAVSAWTTGGNVPDATVKLQTAPAGGGTPHFSFGCGSDDGTSSCNLGAVDAGSAQRQFQAQFTVPLTAAAVASVSLTATGSAANLHTDPVASASVTVLAPPSPIGASASLPALAPIGVSAPAPTLSPGGNASGLFPTLDPSSPATGGAATGGAATGGAALGGARQVANTSSAYTGAASSTGAEVAGLAALALAFILAVTRVSIRRPAPAAPGAAAALPEAPAGSPGQPEQPEDPPAVPPDAGTDDAPKT